MCDFSGAQNWSRLSAGMVWAPCWDWTSLAKYTVWASHLSRVALSSKSRMLFMEKGRQLRHGGSHEVLECICRTSWVSLLSVIKKPRHTSLTRVGTRDWFRELCSQCSLHGSGGRSPVDDVGPLGPPLSRHPHKSILSKGLRKAMGPTPPLRTCGISKEKAATQKKESVS